MRTGEVLNQCYQVTAKLGCGARSTVWLARDLHRWKWQPAEYVAIKVTVTGDVENQEAGYEELRKIKLVSKAKLANKEHLGRHHVRSLLDHFYIRGPAGKHLCMVFEPLREPLGLIKYKWTTEMVSVKLLKVVAKQVLLGLDFPHSEYLSESNIIFRFAEEYRSTTLEQQSHEEWTHPLPVKRLADRTAYLSRNNFGPLVPNLGATVITDFDTSTYGEGDYDRNHDIQPQGYTAPEVLLRAGFSYSADIWNFAVMLCGLVEGKPLFDDPDRELAEFYDENKSFKFPELVPEGASFESFFTHVEGEDNEKMIAFSKRMLRWMPEERSTARELLDDPWLQ